MLREKVWCVYLLECKGGSYYAGITNDLLARYKAHQEGRGSKYTRAHPPTRLIGSRQFPDRSTASQAEWAIKQLPRSKKVAYLNRAHSP
ncbi:MAG: GIY-YIG nuclease family protein [Rudaea sp.]